MNAETAAASKNEKKSLVARFIGYMIENKPDLFFKILRNTRPNLVSPGNGPVFVTRFRDVQEALERPEVFNVTYAAMIDPSVGPYMLGRDCTTINQRDKGIMRALMQREDLPRIRQSVAALADETISKQAQNRRIEIVSQVSRWVPLKLTGAYFGFPGPNMESMMRWSRATQHDMFHNLDNDPVVHEANIRAGQEMKAYLAELIPQRRLELSQNPDLDDILSRLLKSRFPESIEFTEERIAANIMGTLVGGGETTSQAIVNILDQLFKKPDVLAEAAAAALKDDDDLIYRFCWEALRFNPINPFVVRKCVRDYKIASGTLRSARIKEGAIVLVSSRSAMRDGREIPAAGEFCLDRPDYHYLHLGYGLHTCLGDQVSRVQIPEIIKRLLKLPNLRPEGEIDFRDGPFAEEFYVAFDTPH